MAKYRKLGRTSDQRKALIRNQVTALLYHGKIVTTETKAKEIRKIAEHLNIRQSHIIFPFTYRTYSNSHLCRKRLLSHSFLPAQDPYLCSYLHPLFLPSFCFPLPHLPQSRINSALLQKLFMSPALRNPSFLHHYDSVRNQRRRESVGDKKQSLFPSGLFKRLDNSLL